MLSSGCISVTCNRNETIKNQELAAEPINMQKGSVFCFQYIWKKLKL